MWDHHAYLFPESRSACGRDSRFSSSPPRARLPPLPPLRRLPASLPPPPPLRRLPSASSPSPPPRLSASAASPLSPPLRRLPFTASPSLMMFTRLKLLGFEAKHGGAFPKAVKTDTAAAAPKFYPADDVKPRQPNTRKPTDDIKP
ncbi:hypothetical protein GUJ93_ZPchr0005g14380 [Zizania palustris]|uniref:Uncharacterized protein n=1 Tax=Zizania palustris TaxID=103762 RepID=A0A8J5SRY1_ZIZPA|nr:hypothetical protein GUJ93_ZPchr0005g14380 [Zizania palustris]